MPKFRRATWVALIIAGLCMALAPPALAAAAQKKANPISCALIRCNTGFHCVDTATGGKCLPNLTCASVRCNSGFHCVDSTSGPSCVPNLTCQSVRCKSGFRCVDLPTGPSCVPTGYVLPSQ